MTRYSWNAVKAVLLLSLMASLGACDGMRGKEMTKDGTDARMVTVYGYNYTDLYIDGFSVDGQGGSNLAVSTPTAGGSKHVCCVMVRPNQKFVNPVTIRWTRDRKQWCELDVKLNEPAPANPEYFEVHFYQDGHVEAAVTEKASEPRVKQARFNYAERHESGNVNNDAKFARCANGG
jgi:hypothetical protein